MKLATRDKNLLIFLLVCIIIVCAYLFGYKRFTEQKDQLIKETEVLEKQIATKREQEKKKAFYVLMTEVYEEKFEEELAKFPAGIEEENQLMFFKSLEERLSTEEYPFTLSTVNFSQPKSSSKFAETAALTGKEYMGESSTVSFPYTLTYEKFKELLDILEQLKERSVISTISASYSEELGFVSGSVTFTQYAISEETRILLKPDVKDMELGTDNIFTTDAELDVPETEKAELTIDVIAKRIESSYDMFVVLDAAASKSSTTMGFAENGSVLKDSKNDVQLITIIIDEIPVDDLTKPIYDENGVHKMDENGNLLYEAKKVAVIDPVTGLQAMDPATGEAVWKNVYEYRATYIIGEGDNAEKIENVLIQPSEYLDLYVYCEDRIYAEETENGFVDKASVKATVINNTTKYEFINIYIVENNLMTEEEKAALAKEEALREENKLAKREDLTLPRWTIDEEKSTMDKIKVITTSDVANYLATVSEESEEVTEEPSEEITEEPSEEVTEEPSDEIVPAA